MLWMGRQPREFSALISGQLSMTDSQTSGQVVFPPLSYVQRLPA